MNRDLAVFVLLTRFFEKLNQQTSDPLKEVISVIPLEGPRVTFDQFLVMFEWYLNSYPPKVREHRMIREACAEMAMNTDWDYWLGCSMLEA